MSILHKHKEHWGLVFTCVSVGPLLPFNGVHLSCLLAFVVWRSLERRSGRKNGLLQLYVIQTRTTFFRHLEIMFFTLRHEGTMLLPTQLYLSATPFTMDPRHPLDFIRMSLHTTTFCLEDETRAGNKGSKEQCLVKKMEISVCHWPKESFNTRG